MAYKAVLFQRVSTNQQDTMRQNIDLTKVYKADGYKDDEVYIINYKESGVKLSYQQRQGMIELEQVIDSNPIEIVYVHEITRVARREDVTFTLIQKLTDRGINLHIQTPQVIRTLNTDKTENPLAKLIISFLAYFAYMEAKQTKIRMKSGREALKAEGKVYTSSAKFGYKVVNKRLQIDAEDSAVVKRIFDDFLNTDMSTTEIYRKYNDLGLLKKCNAKTVHAGGRYIGNMLRDKTYCGEHDVYQYPAIISKEDNEKATKKLLERSHTNRLTKEMYYARHLLRIDGHAMTPYLWDNAYHYNADKYLDGSSRILACINMNVADSILEHEAMPLYAVYTASKSVEEKEWAVGRLSEIEADMEALMKQQKKSQKEFDKAIELFKRDTITIEDVESAKKMNEMTQAKLANKIDALNLEKANLTANLTNEKDYADTLEDMWLNATDEQKYDIIHAMIDRVEVEMAGKCEYILTVFPKVFPHLKQENTEIEVTEGACAKYRYTAKGRWTTLKKIKNGIEIPVDWEISKRHEAKRCKKAKEARAKRAKL